MDQEWVWTNCFSVCGAEQEAAKSSPRVAARLTGMERMRKRERERRKRRRRRPALTLGPSRLRGRIFSRNVA